MYSVKSYLQRYIDWVIRLGKVRFSLLGLIILAVYALVIQSIATLLFTGHLYWSDIFRSIFFGLVSAPFVIYFFSVIIESLERSRRSLSTTLQDLKQQTAERIAYQKIIERQNQEKTNLMTTISHELKTPLNGIIGLSQILLDGQLTQQQRDYLQTINISAVSLGHIFSDLVDLEKIETHRITLFERDIYLSDLLNTINHLAVLMTAQKGLSFTLIKQPHLPEYISVDSVRLSQILWNLINNAVKFTPTGGIQLKVEQEQSNQLLFKVIDTGIGISSADQEKIFDLYYQVKSADNMRALGSGIGLSVSKQIAHLMEGDLTVTSELNQGTIFTLSVAVKELSLPNHIEYKSDQSAFSESLHILLVEDIEVNIIVATSVLTKLGHSVDVARTGTEALQKFSKNNYDLLLLDIQLPDLSGFEVAQQLRKKYANDEIDYLPPLVALTANILNDKKEYIQRGMDDVLAKPLKVEQLNQALATIFSSEVEINESKDTNSIIINECFDIELLNDLKALLGLPAVLNNITLFEQLMPEYVQELNQNYQAYCHDNNLAKELAESAHKIKGATAAIGLLSIQQIAQQAQQNEEPQWQIEIGHWVKQIDSRWKNDLNQLKTWLQTSS